jgi:predicted phosphodiesterase
VLSDVHANLAALEAVLVDVDAEGVDELWCLGDLTGYGARPNECVALMRERADICLVGNHDLVVRGDLGVDAFTSDAAEAASYARAQLKDAEREWLRTLAPLGQRAGVELYHGSIRDPVWEYVLTAEIALACLNRQRSTLALVGHSHVALAVHSEHGELKGGLAAPDSLYDLRDRHCLLNPGSVGQPRDRDPRASWLLLDLAVQSAHFRRSEYDIARTQAEIREAGLPERLAARLSGGV